MSRSSKQDFAGDLLPCYQLSPGTNYRQINKRLAFQKCPHIWKAIHCVFVLFTLETVLPYLLDLRCTFLSTYVCWYSVWR